MGKKSIFFLQQKKIGSKESKQIEFLITNIFEETQLFYIRGKRL